MSILQSFTFQELKNLLPNRAKDSHKGNFGKVLICAGSPGMGGAGILASEASLFCGSGLVTLVTDTSNVSPSLLRNPEVMAIGVDMVEGVDIDLKIKDHSVILYGPGIANTAFAKTILVKILKSANNSKITFYLTVLNSFMLVFLLWMQCPVAQKGCLLKSKDCKTKVCPLTGKNIGEAKGSVTE